MNAGAAEGAAGAGVASPDRARAPVALVAPRTPAPLPSAAVGPAGSRAPDAVGSPAGVDAGRGPDRHLGPLFGALVANGLAVILTLWSAADWPGPRSAEGSAATAMAVAWGVTGLILALRRWSRLGAVVGVGTLCAGAALLGSWAIARGESGAGLVAAEAGRAFGVALLGPAVLALFLALPEGAIGSRSRRATLAAAGALGLGVGGAV